MKAQTLHEIASEIYFTLQHRSGIAHRNDLISGCERAKLAWAIGEGPCPNTVYHANVEEGIEESGNCDICGN